MVKVQDIIEKIEAFSPKQLAESWDNVGLQLGSVAQDVTRILVTLDVTPSVVSEAIDKKVDMIISHHPFIFGGIKTLHADTYDAQVLVPLIKHGIALYAAHTNMDNAQGGMNDWLCAELGLPQGEPLEVQGTYALNGKQLPYGTGRIAELEQPVLFEHFLQRVDDVLLTKGIKYHKQHETVKRVAICGGAGSDFYQLAIAHHADVYITGDVSYHKAQEMAQYGLSLIDAGHYIEHVFCDKITHMIQEWSHANHWEIQVIPSEMDTDPFTWYQS